MSDGNPTSQTVNELNDYFSLDGVETPSNLISGQKDSSLQPNNQQSAGPNANNAANSNQQQQPANSQSQGTQQPNAQQPQSAQPPKGFEQNFFKTDDKGNQVFDHELALSQLFKPQDNVSQQQTIPNYRQMSQQQPQQQPAQQQQSDNKPAWQKEYEELQTRRDNYVKNMTAYRDFLIEGLNAGYQGQSALDYAQQKINQLVETEIRRYEYESRAKREEENSKRVSAEEAFKPLQDKAGINMLAQYNALGGKDKFEQLVFGVQHNGQLVGGYGVDFINHMIDMAYEFAGKEFPKTEKEMQKAYNDFYTRIASKPERLQYLVEMAQTRLAKAILPQISNVIRANKDAQLNQQGRAQTQGSSHIQSPQQPGQSDPLSEYLGADYQGRYQFDTV